MNESNIKIETKVTLKIKDVKVSLTIDEARQLVQELGAVVGKEYCTRQHYYTSPFYVSSGTTSIPLSTTITASGASEDNSIRYPNGSTISFNGEENLKGPITSAFAIDVS